MLSYQYQKMEVMLGIRRCMGICGTRTFTDNRKRYKNRCIEEICTVKSADAKDPGTRKPEEPHYGVGKPIKPRTENRGQAVANPSTKKPRNQTTEDGLNWSFTGDV